MGGRGGQSCKLRFAGFLTIFGFDGCGWGDFVRKKCFWVYSDYQLLPGNSSKKADQPETLWSLQDTQLPLIELRINGQWSLMSKSNSCPPVWSGYKWCKISRKYIFFFYKSIYFSEHFHLRLLSNSKIFKVKWGNCNQQSTSSPPGGTSVVQAGWAKGREKPRAKLQMLSGWEIGRELIKVRSYSTTPPPPLVHKR